MQERKESYQIHVLQLYVIFRNVITLIHPWVHYHPQLYYSTQYAIRHKNTDDGRPFVRRSHFCLHKDIILYSIKKTHFYTFGSWDYILHDIYYSNYKKMISKLLQVLHLYFLIAISHDNVSILWTSMHSWELMKRARRHFYFLKWAVNQACLPLVVEIRKCI